MMISNHYNKQRYRREKFIQKHIFDDGHIIDGFIVDKNHENGAECHSITDNGIIIIHNLQTGVLITKLIARPNQIKRYYEKTGRKPPLEYKRALFLAKWHESLGYNNV
ncbi:MAG: hypothetical protein PUC23_03630 [bacterium]|nr:hypothetical protein [bacterium]